MLFRSAKVDALRVDQDYLTGCSDAPQYLAGVGVAHPIQGGRLGVRLLEVDLGLRADVETGPVDYRSLAGLVDVEGVTRLADGGLSCTHHPALGELLSWYALS